MLSEERFTNWLILVRNEAVHVHVVGDMDMYEPMWNLAQELLELGKQRYGPDYNPFTPQKPWSTGT